MAASEAEAHVENCRVVLTEDEVPGAKLTKPPSDCNVLELKRWLECHGEKKSGKKQELVDRVNGCISLKIKVDPKVDGGKWYDIKAKSSTSTDTESFTKFPESGWGNFPSRNIPVMFNYGYVYHHLVESVVNLLPDDNNEDDEAVDVGDTVTAKPLKKGRGLLKSGFVENCHDNDNDDSYFLRCHVHHSMKSDLPLQVFVRIGKVSGFIQQVSCTCKARELNRCCHVAAVLLMLSDYVSDNGHVVVEPSTSQPCEWNKGKKRMKDPKALHKSSYKSSKKSSSSALYNWDPRPVEFQNKVDQDGVHTFLRNLQAYSATQGTLSMWETLLQINYQDFKLDDADVVHYKSLVTEFETALADSLSSISNNFTVGQIPNTESQSKSEEWCQARWCRITASICKVVVGMGEQVLNNTVSPQRCYNWLRNKLWYPDNITTFDMQYGIEEEPSARKAYTDKTGNNVTETGIWVNTKYPHLGASPDGIVKSQDSFGIVEIKCLKVLRNQTVTELINSVDIGKPNKVLDRQCFSIVNGKLVLKKGHAYYYQVQMLLLVTEADYCDFVLHTPKGEPHVERFYHDKETQAKIVEFTKIVWSKVLIPEYFLMKTPRRLLPVVLY